MRKSMLFGAVAVLATLGVANVETLSLGAAPANAAVYLQDRRLPEGLRRAARHRPSVVYCKRVGYPRGCVMR